MSTLVNAMRTSDTLTENGMVTNSTTLDSVLDLFFVIGAMRPQLNSDEGIQRLISKFEAAYSEDPLLTRKLLFWARDIRQGAGEREAFRILLKHTSERFPKDVILNLPLIAEFGRWDDVFETFGTPVEPFAIGMLIENLQKGNSLLAKWMPRTGGKVSTNKKHISNKVRVAMGLTPKEFRKTLVKLTNVVETNMCNKDYANINYSHVPSLAMSRYTNAFKRNDSEGFGSYLESLVKGETKINSGAVYPYDILKNLKRGNSTLSNEQWKALPNFLEGSKERVLPVCDVSGSMETSVSGETTAMDVCISLGLYISERNEGPFKDAFVTFSSRPQLQYLKGDLYSRFQQLQSSDWGMSTDLEATFEMILNQATKHNVPTDEMPTAILIMSDMEFNQATRRNNKALDMIKEKYESSGYTMPKVIFWNLCSRHDNFPVQVGEDNTALISGFSPSILKSVLAGEAMNPISIMLKTLNTERYLSVQ